MHIYNHCKIQPLFKFLLAACLIFTAGPRLSPQNQSQDVSEYEKRLNRLAAEIQGLQSAISREKKKETSILSRLGRIGLEKKLILSQIDMYAAQQERAQQEIKTLRDEIPRREEDLEKEREAIERILITLYKFGRFNYAELMLQADSVGSLLSESKNLLMLAEEQDKIISQYLASLDELNKTRERLEAKRIEISQLMQNSREKQRELETQDKMNRALIYEINQNIKSHEQVVTEKRERAQQLQSLMKEILEKKLDLPFALIPMDERKGQLPWPIPTRRVVSRFGVVRHPTYNTTTRNNGIEIAPQESMLVKSVHPGIVRYAGYHEGYGHLIIVDHGMTYYTLYGHCSEFYVENGQAVEAGDTIARVGDIGSLEGVTLYFEVRHGPELEPLNPLHWLKRR